MARTKAFDYFADRLGKTLKISYHETAVAGKLASVYQEGYTLTLTFVEGQTMTLTAVKVEIDYEKDFQGDPSYLYEADSDSSVGKVSELY